MGATTARGSASQNLTSSRRDNREQRVLNVAKGRFEPKMNCQLCPNLAIGPKGLSGVPRTGTEIWVVPRGQGHAWGPEFSIITTET